MVSIRELSYWYIKRPAHKVPYWIAARMPKWLVYHCAIRLIANACGSKYPAQCGPELTAMDALKRWGEAPPNTLNAR